MKATDITWGGEVKCELRVEDPMPAMSAGEIITLEYDNLSQKYSMLHRKNRHIVIPVDTTSKGTMEEYIRDGSWRANLVNVIEVMDHSLIVQIRTFFAIIDFNELQALKIQITDKVVEKLPKYAKPNPIKFLNEEFIYQNNIIFANNFENKVKLQIISRSWRLDVERKGKEYVASNIRRDAADIVNSIYLLRGSIEFVDSTQDASVSKEVAEKLRLITNPDSYFAIWDAYNGLEKLLLFKQAVEDGIAKYSDYEVEVQDAFIYKFRLKENALENCVDENSQIDCTDNAEILRVEKWEDLSEIRNFKPISLGKILRIDHDYLYIVDETSDTKKSLPKSGYLFKSISGDSARIQRRIQAKADIANGVAPVPNLAILINDGLSVTKQTRHEQAITNHLKETMKKNLGRAFDFNVAQKTAIEVALNTPDIALIQGPPGTGKTTVIKAIIARFEEYFEKNNEGEIPRILVTSFQHEAVDNAISNATSSGLPANRLGGRRGEESKQQAVIRSWINKEIARCTAITEKYYSPQIFRKLNVIKDEYFAWYSKGKDLLEGINLINKIVQSYRLDLSTELINKMDSIIARTRLKDEKSDGLERAQEIAVQAFVAVLNKQRCDPVSFADDGLNNALELRYTLEAELVKGEMVPECLLQVILTKGLDERAFYAYTKYIKSLKEKYPNQTKQTSDKRIGVMEIEFCIDRALKELKYSMLETQSNKDEAKAFILQNYLENIANEQAAKRIIDQFSNIRAATCQQAMELGKNASNVHYDLVIVDEAARANPLDLFIPMSMGKQVILVGDHKQLPHLLEPEVVKKLSQDEKLKELGILGKSLFERLYDIFEKQKKNGGVPRTCKLNIQYRMHPIINDFISELYYGDLKCGLDDLSKLPAIDTFERKPAIWIEVNKHKYGPENTGISKSREKEAAVLIEYVIKVLRQNADVTIGIITFYAKQKEIIDKIAEMRLTSDELSRIEIGTVDSFQGKEFDIVFLSCVRANDENPNNIKKRVGFVNDNNRLCVSLSRARSSLVITGDSETVSIIPALKKFIALCKNEVGKYIDA